MSSPQTNYLKKMTFDGGHELWIFNRSIRDVDYFFDWSILSDNKIVKFYKMKPNFTRKYWGYCREYK